MSAQELQTAASFVQQLADDLNAGNMELPMFPDSVIRIQQAFSADEVDINEVVRLTSSDPALAARVLQLANSAAMRSSMEITDVRQAIIRMGNKMVQSSVVLFALRQVEQNEGRSGEYRDALKAIWQESVELAASCYVVAKNYTKVSPDEALLTGLLSVIGRLYILMKSQEQADLPAAELERILHDWHPTIGKAIAETWGMAEELAFALESQLETDLPPQEAATLSEVLCVSKLIYNHRASSEPLIAKNFPLLMNLGIADHDDTDVSLDAHTEAIDAIRKGLSG